MGPHGAPNHVLYVVLYLVVLYVVRNSVGTILYYVVLKKEEEEEAEEAEEKGIRSGT